MALGVGPTSVGSGARAVRAHGENFPLHVGTSVIEIDGARANCKGNILPEATERPIAVVEKSSNRDRRKRAIFFGSCFDIVGQRGAVMGVEALLFPREPNLYRTTGLARQQSAEQGEPARDLHAKGTAEIRGYDPTGFHRQAQNASRTILQTVRILHRTPKRAGVVFIDGHTGARLMGDGIYF